MRARIVAEHQLCHKRKRSRPTGLVRRGRYDSLSKLTLLFFFRKFQADRFRQRNTLLLESLGISAKQINSYSYQVGFILLWKSHNAQRICE